MARERKVSGQKLAELRTSRKLDQTELATRLRKRGLGATQATVSRWENGQEPRARVLPLLADELGCSIEELYGDEDEEESSMPALPLLDQLFAEVAALRARVPEGARNF